MDDVVDIRPDPLDVLLVLPDGAWVRVEVTIVVDKANGPTYLVGRVHGWDDHGQLMVAAQHQGRNVWAGRDVDVQLVDRGKVDK